jgi:hypothetical protein
MFDFDWQPSTTMEAPLTQLARGDARNATRQPRRGPKRPRARCGTNCRCHRIGLLAL